MSRHVEYIEAKSADVDYLPEEDVYGASEPVTRDLVLVIGSDDTALVLTGTEEELRDLIPRIEVALSLVRE